MWRNSQTKQQQPSIPSALLLLPSDEAVCGLLASAAANPLPLEDVLARLGASLHRNVIYLQHGERRGW